MMRQVLTKRNSTLMILIFFLVLLTAHVSLANTVDSCAKLYLNQCLKESKDATHDICKKACEKMCIELQWSQEKYIVTKRLQKSIACRWMNFGCP